MVYSSNVTRKIYSIPDCALARESVVLSPCPLICTLLQNYLSNLYFVLNLVSCFIPHQFPSECLSIFSICVLLKLVWEVAEIPGSKSRLWSSMLIERTIHSRLWRKRWARLSFRNTQQARRWCSTKRKAKWRHRLERSWATQYHTSSCKLVLVICVLLWFSAITFPISPNAVMF